MQRVPNMLQEYHITKPPEYLTTKVYRVEQQVSRMAPPLSTGSSVMRSEKMTCYGTCQLFGSQLPLASQNSECPTNISSHFLLPTICRPAWTY